MKILNRLASLTVFLVLSVAACKKEKSLETGGIVSGLPQWEFAENASKFKGIVDTAFIEDLPNGERLTVEGPSSDGTGTILLEITAPSIVPRTYKNPEVYFHYSSGISTVYESNPLHPDEFEVTITSISATEVRGTFSGTVAYDNDSTVITNGKFTGKLGNAVPPVAGELLFWSKASCTAG
ncbi:MAG: hypothetical protein H7Y31_14875, partial [Chitinophagaceae bacterium]|nr:hypothetical protein [Chitinophagaceae bacterium]